MNSIRKSLGYSLLSSNTVTGLQFVGSLIIARLLTPEQIGIFSVAAVVVALAQIVRDLGVSGYIIQVEELTTEILRAAFGLALLAAASIALALSLASGSIAAFYAEPRLQDVMLVLALNFALTPFGSVTMACIRREMGFRAIAVADVLSALVSLGVTISLAYLGHGAMSLAWGAIAGTVVSVVAAQVLRPAYMPFWPSLRGASEILKFGSITTSTSIVSYLNMSVTDLVLGKLTGMSAVAYFNRAASLNRFFGGMITKALGPVLLPVMSQIKRDGGSVREAFLNGTVLATGLIWPLYAAIAVLAEPLIIVMFGDQWHSSVELVPYIALTALLSATYTMSGSSFVAIGRPSFGLIAESINLPIKVITVILTAPLGVLIVAKSWPWIALAGAVVQQILIKRALDIGPWQLITALNKSMATAVFSVTGTIVAYQIIVKNFPSSALIFHLIAGGSGTLVAWIASIYLFDHPLRSEIQRVFRSFKNKIYRNTI